MEPLSLRSVLRLTADVRFRMIDREAVVVRQRAAEVLVLNEVAARILALADGVSPMAGWLDILTAEFEVPRDTLERDVIGFAAELVEQGLLEAA
jgi:hypothetical protein